MRKGIGVSPGVVVGTAYCINEIFVNPATRQLEAEEVMPELAHYERARDAAADDLHSLYSKVASQVGPAEAAIFQAHEAILRDPSFTKKIRSWIVDQHQSAPYALNQVLQEYTALFEKTKDAYIRERLADVRDVILRISGHLSEVLHPEIESSARAADRRGR